MIHHHGYLVLTIMVVTIMVLTKHMFDLFELEQNECVDNAYIKVVIYER